MTNPAAAGQPDPEQEVPGPVNRRRQERRQGDPRIDGGRAGATVPLILSGRVREEVKALLHKRRFTATTGLDGSKPSERCRCLRHGRGRFSVSMCQSCGTACHIDGLGVRVKLTALLKLSICPAFEYDVRLPIIRLMIS